jgi:hypothetical protein
VGRNISVAFDPTSLQTTKTSFDAPFAAKERTNDERDACQEEII